MFTFKLFYMLKRMKKTIPLMTFISNISCVCVRARVCIIFSHYVLEYKKKLYSFQEDAEQLEGFQTQEMAKVKHLVCVININN